MTDHKMYQSVHSFICPHCGEEIFPPEGKSLFMRDKQAMRDYMNKKKYWKGVRERKAAVALEKLTSGGDS